MGLTKHAHLPPGTREAELAAIKETNPTLCPTLLWKEGAAPHTQCFFFLEACRSPHTPPTETEAVCRHRHTHRHTHNYTAWDGGTAPHTHTQHRGSPQKRDLQKHHKDKGGGGGGREQLLSPCSRCVCGGGKGVTHSEESKVTNRPPRATENPATLQRDALTAPRGGPGPPITSHSPHAQPKPLSGSRPAHR